MFREEAKVRETTARKIANDLENSLALEIIEILASPGQHPLVSFLFLQEHVAREHAERIVKAANDSMVRLKDARIRILVHGLQALGAQSICKSKEPFGVNGITLLPEIRQKIGIGAETKSSLADANAEYGKALRSISIDRN